MVGGMVVSFANHSKTKMCIYIYIQETSLFVNKCNWHLFLRKKTAATMANREGFVIIIIAFLIHLSFVLDVPNWWVKNVYFFNRNWYLPAM